MESVAEGKVVKISFTVADQDASQKLLRIHDVDGSYGSQVDSIWIILGKVKTLLGVGFEMQGALDVDHSAIDDDDVLAGTIISPPAVVP